MGYQVTAGAQYSEKIDNTMAMKDDQTPQKAVGATITSSSTGREVNAMDCSDSSGSVASRRARSGRLGRSLKRRVRFDLDRNTIAVLSSDRMEMSRTGEPYDAWPTTDSQVDEMWWTNDEARAIKSRAEDVSEFIFLYRKDYISAATTLLASCAQSKLKTIPFTAKDDVLRIMLESPARGLENDLVPMLTCRQVRCAAVVLEAQKRLMSEPAEKREHLIALLYRRCSRYSALWARSLAEIDAAAASKCHKL